MANNIYAIPIKMLYDDRNDPHMDSFIADLKIHLTDYRHAQYPTVSDLKFAIENCGFEILNEQFENFYGEKGWSCGINVSEEFNTPVSVDNVTKETQPITKLISFPRGKWELVITVLIELAKNTDDILFYCDSGQMSLITKDKTIEKVLEELE